MQVLKQVSLSNQNVKLINIAPDAAAYTGGKIDIAVSYNPFLGKANAAQKDGLRLS